MYVPEINRYDTMQYRRSGHSGPYILDPAGRLLWFRQFGGRIIASDVSVQRYAHHRVLTYSGTYVNQQWPVSADAPHGAWEFHENLIPNSPVKPIRLWMEVGENDNGAKSPEEGFHNWVLANNRMAEMLKAKGYHYRYVFAEGAKHVDKGVVGQTLPEALEWLWRGYTVD